MTINIPTYHIAILGTENSGKKTLGKALLKHFSALRFLDMELHYFIASELLSPYTAYDNYDFTTSVLAKADELQPNTYLQTYLYGIDDYSIITIAELKFCYISEDIFNMDFAKQLEQSTKAPYKALSAADVWLYCYDPEYDWGLLPIKVMQVTSETPTMDVLTKVDTFIDFSVPWTHPLLRAPKQFGDYDDGMSLLYLHFWNTIEDTSFLSPFFSKDLGELSSPLDRRQLQRLRTKILPSETQVEYTNIYSYGDNKAYRITIAKNLDDKPFKKDTFFTGNLEENGSVPIGVFELTNRLLHLFDIETTTNYYTIPNLYYV